MLPIVIFFATLAVLAVAAYLVVMRLRQTELPRELDPDWWTEFQRQFAKYAADCARRRPGSSHSSRRPR